MYLDDDDDARDDSRDARAPDDARDDAPGGAPGARDNAAPRLKRAYDGNTEQLAARKEARNAKRNEAKINTMIMISTFRDRSWGDAIDLG